MKRLIIHVRWHKALGRWIVLEGTSQPTSFPRKVDAVGEARAAALRYHAAGGLAQVRVYRKRGQTVQTEWTYGKDPRKSKG